MSIVSKVRRKAMRYSNRFFGADQASISRLETLMASPPPGAVAANAWNGEFAQLINETVLDRMTKEDLAYVLAGLVSYRKTGITPQSTQGALVRAYETTSGLFQEILHKALFDNMRIAAPTTSRLFGEISTFDIERIARDMNTDGYTVLPWKIPAAMVAAANEEAKSFHYRLKGGEQSGKQLSGIEPASPPKCVSAYSDSPLTPTLQSIVDDELLNFVASNHLGTSAKSIDSTFWYTFPNPVASSEAAQLFHYDLDTIRWVKAFVYLSDVGEGNGPHEYVSGTHLAGNKVSKVLLGKEYARISDAEIDQYYPGCRKRISGPAGTVLIGDTRCFHKGNSVRNGHRLVFSPIYAPSRIGYFHG